MKKKGKKKKTRVSEVLGELPISSHIEHYAKRRWVYIFIGILPFALGIIALIIYLLWEISGLNSGSDSFVEDVLNIIKNLWKWIRTSASVLTALFVFAIGFSVSGLLTVLAGRYKTLGAKGKLHRKSYWPVWSLVTVVTLIGIVGAFFIIRTDSTRVNFFWSMVLVGPVLLAILVLGPILDFIDGQRWRGTKVLLWVGGVIVSIALAAMITPLVNRITGKMQSFLIENIDEDVWNKFAYGEVQFGFLPARETLAESLGTLVGNIFIIVGVLFLTSWLLWQRPGDKEEEIESSKKPKKGFIARAFASVKKIFGFGSGEDEASKKAPEEWFDALLEAKLDGCLQQTSPEEPDSEKSEFSRPFPESHYATFFGDVVPTVDQDRCLGLFLTSLNRDFTNLCSSDDSSTGDMLIQGADGAGRTTWIAAAAIAAVILRGDNVLVICPDRAKADVVTNDIKNLLNNSRVQDIVLVSRFNTGLLKALEAEDLAAVPEVLVATSDEIEMGFFKDTSSASKVKKAAIRMLDTIFVTDIMDRFTSKNRLMLPFLLGKIRLINEVARGSVQVVVFIPDSLDKVIQNEVGNRLLSPIRKWSAEKLRKWRTATNKVVNVELEPSTGDESSLDRAIVSISRFLLEKNQYVVILRRNFTPAQLQKLHAKLLPEDIDEDHLMVVSSLDALKTCEATEDEEKHDWCIVVNHLTHDALTHRISVPLIRNAEHTAVINLGLPANVESTKSKHMIIPALGSSKSQGVLVRELAKAVPYIELGAPVHRNIWRQFGVPETGRIHNKTDEETVLNSFSFLIDPPEQAGGFEHVDVDTVKNYRNIFPWIQLAGYVGHHAEVESVDESCALYHLRLRSNTELVITKRQLAGNEEQRVAEWFVEGQMLNNPSLDLAQTQVIALDDADTKWIPRTIINDNKNRTRIEGAHARGDDNEAPLPKWSGCIVIPEGSTIVPTAGLPSGIRWSQFRDSAQIKSVPVPVTWALNGHYTESANLIPISPVEFTYEAIASMLVLGTGKDYRGNDHAYSGSWAIDSKENDHEFWPEMTAALMAGLIGCAPDAASLGRILAFRIKDEPAVANVLILELPDLSGTLDEIFRLIFNSDAMRKQFFANALEVIRRVSHVKDDPDSCFECLALLARQSMGDFNTTLDCKTAETILLRILDQSSEGDI